MDDTTNDSKKIKKWDQVDTTCSSCGQVTEKCRGFTRQNMKRLIKPQWTSQDMILLIVIAMMCLLAYLYKVETQTAREFASEMRENPKAFCDKMLKANERTSIGKDSRLDIQLNISGLDLGNDYIPQI